MSLPALHIIIYSEVLIYSGGRETWLGYFLPLLAARERFRAITVYQMRPSAPEDALRARLPPCPGTPVEFVAGPDVLHGPEGPLQRFGGFARAVLGDLHTRIERGDMLLAVGVHGEIPPALGAWLFSRLTRRGVHLVTWVREASMVLVKERRGRLIHGAFVALRHALLLASARVITNGADTLAIHQQAFPHLRGRMLLIPNAVDMQRYAGPLPDVTQRPLQVGFLARFIAAKGFFDVLEAARRVADDASIAFTAWGHSPDPIQDVPPTVTLADPVPHSDVPAALASCHVILILNQTRNLEMGGLSHSLLEALASGRAVIAWDNACHRQVLNERNSFLVPEGDHAALAALLRDLARDPEPLLARAAAGRETAAQYAQETHVETFLREVVDPVLGKV